MLNGTRQPGGTQLAFLLFSPPHPLIVLDKLKVHLTTFSLIHQRKMVNMAVLHQRITQEFSISGITKDGVVLLVKSTKR